MNTEAYHLVLNYLAAFSLISLALSVFLHPVRGQFHKSFAILLAVLGMSYWLDSFAQERESAIYAQLAETGFSCFLILAFYYTLIFRHFKFSELNAKDRVALRVVFYGVVISIFLFVGHYLSQLNILELDLSLYSGFLSITAVYILSKMYFTQGTHSVSTGFKQLGNILLFSLVTAGVLFLSGVVIISQQQFYLSVGVICSSALIFSSLHVQMSSALNGRVARYLDALAELSKASLPQFLKELSESELFRKVVLLSPNEIASFDCRDAYSLLSPGTVYGLAAIEQSLKRKNLGGINVGALLAIQSLLKQNEAQALTVIPGSEFILVATQEPLSSYFVFQSLLVHVAQIIERFVQVPLLPPDKWPDNVIPFKDQISYQDS